MIIQRIFSIPTDQLLLTFLAYSKPLREFCGFTKVPDASKITRFKQDFIDDLQLVFDSNVCVSVYFEDETFWLTTKAMAELFGVKSQAITKHLGNIYEEEELTREATCSKKEQVQIEGGREVKRNLDFYNLDAIIAVGYRVNSKKATKFRQWATKTLKEYITKGFVLNDDMLKNGKPFPHGRMLRMEKY